MNVLHRVVDANLDDSRVLEFNELPLGTIFSRVVILKGVEKYAFTPAIKISKKYAQSFGYTGKEKFEGWEKCKLVTRLSIFQTDTENKAI